MVLLLLTPPGYLVGHLKYWQTEAELALGHMEDEESILEYIDEKSYSVGIDNVKGRMKPTLSEINVNTDVSKTKQGSGAGYVIMIGKVQVKFTHSLNLPHTVTIFQVELPSQRQSNTYY